MPIRKLKYILWALLAFILASCAPSMTGSKTPLFRAAFSDLGVVWVSSGRACVARHPEYRVFCPKLPNVVDVAWNGGDAWAALPGSNIVITLDRNTQSVQAGAVTLLSRNRIYREDGSALSYTGRRVIGVAGRPYNVVTDSSGVDYVILAGKIRRVGDGFSMGRANKKYFVATANSATTTDFPTVYSAMGTYRIKNGQLERLDNTSTVLGSIQHGRALVGVVNNTVITVSPAGKVRRFTGNLKELY